MVCPGNVCSDQYIPPIVTCGTIYSVKHFIHGVYHQCSLNLTPSLTSSFPRHIPCPSPRPWRGCGTWRRQDVPAYILTHASAGLPCDCRRKHTTQSHDFCQLTPLNHDLSLKTTQPWLVTSHHSNTTQDCQLTQPHDLSPHTSGPHDTCYLIPFNHMTHYLILLNHMTILTSHHGTTWLAPPKHNPISHDITWPHDSCHLTSMNHDFPSHHLTTAHIKFPHEAKQLNWTLIETSNC